jgi:TRAP-type C4-dicarboxylate transport system permease small subunit
MMRSLLKTVRGGFIRLLEILVTAMVALLTLTVLWGVFTRFCLGRQAEFTDELARVLLVWVSMVGAALAFGAKAHLGVDFFVSKLHPEARKALSLLVQMITAVLAVTVFIGGGWELSCSQMGQQLPTLPISRGIVYASIPLGGILICLFALENAARIIATPAEQLEAQTKSEE